MYPAKSSLLIIRSSPKKVHYGDFFIEQMSLAPYATVAVSTAVYSLLLRSVAGPDGPGDKLHAAIKATSAAHSACTSLLALQVLRTIPRSAFTASASKSRDTTGHLDDSANPLIAASSSLANALTAWETGYLLYDTGALLAVARLKSKSGSLTSALTKLAQESPIFLAHHVLLAAALSYLQTYIAAGREKGVYVIVAFLLMNASNPVLHARWWIRTRFRQARNARLGVDALLVVVFALSRFGTVWWVLNKYGQYHGLGAWSAYKRLRRSCQVGTAALVGLNGLWWVLLVRSVSIRALMRGGRRVRD